MDFESKTYYLFPLVITKFVDGKNDEVLGQISDFIKITIVDAINKYMTFY